MTGKERLHAAMDGKTTDLTAVMPKMWVDVAARVMGISMAEAMGDPARSTAVIVDAARKLGADGARLLLFPRREFEPDGRGGLLHTDGQGSTAGTVDMSGGWKTCLAGRGFFDLENPGHMAHYHCYQSSVPLISGMDDAKRFTVPTACYYEDTGCGDIVSAALANAGDSLACVGDCNSGTLPLLAALRGMTEAMLDLVDNRALAHAIMEKGVEMALERARFFVARGVHILRYNDSVANMSVISPRCFREFVLPRIRDFCAGAHALSPDVKVYCHICGNVLPVLPDLAASGLDCIAPLDPLGGFTLAQARAAAGSSVVLMGGVNTLSFIRSTPEEIMAEAQECIRRGSEGGGYLLGSGCALPPDTKLENLAAVIQAAHGQDIR